MTALDFCVAMAMTRSVHNDAKGAEDEMNYDLAITARSHTTNDISWCLSERLNLPPEINMADDRCAGK